MALADEITTRIPSQRLIQLTNEGGVAKTVNAAVLAAACSDAQGHLRRVIGITPDYTQDWQMSLLLQGVIAYLETYKGGDYPAASAKLDAFDKALFNSRRRAAMVWETNSLLEPSADRTA